MIFLKKESDEDKLKGCLVLIRKSFIFVILIILFFYFRYVKYNNIIFNYKKEKNNINNDIDEKEIKKNDKNIYSEKKGNINIPSEKCYYPPVNENIKIIHLILTRFIMEHWKYNNYTKRIYDKDYIINGIRVIKKYLFPSLESQSCKEFIWILLLGKKANITYVKSLFDFKIPFKFRIIFENNIKNFLRNITKGYDVLISTRIDYDDRIYYDAVNDVRKAINIYKPMSLYGYNRGVYYYEEDNKYYDFNDRYKADGAMSIFLSLIIVLSKVNDIYIIHDIGSHPFIKKSLLKSYKLFGIKNLNYEPAFFDSGNPKFVWVRHNYSGLYIYSNNLRKNLTVYNFNLTKFYGK